MSFGGNKAQIDLVANAEAMKPGLSDAKQYVDNYAKDIVEELGKSEVSVEALEAAFKALSEEITKAVDDNAKYTSETIKNVDAANRHRAALASLLSVIKDNVVTIGLLTAVVIKSGGSVTEMATKVKALTGALVTLGTIAVNATIGLGKFAVGSIAVGKAATNTAGSIAKKTVQVAALTANLAKANPYLAAAAAAMAVLGAAFTVTGKKMELTNNSLTKSRDLIDNFRGDVKQIEAELKKLGLTAEDMGLKSVTNWTKISDATGTTFEKLTKLGAAWQMIKDNAGEAYQYVISWNDVWLTNLSDGISYSINEWGRYAEESRDKVTDFMNWMTGMSEKQIEEQAKIRRQERNGPELARQRELVEKQFAADIKRAKEYDGAINQTRQDEEELRKIQAISQIDGTNGTAVLIKKHLQYRQELIYTGKFIGAEGDNWIKKFEALNEQQDKLRESAFEWVDALSQVDKVVKDVEENEKKLQEQRVKETAPLGLLLTMLEDEKQKIKEIQALEGEGIAFNEAKTEGVKKSLAEIADLQQRIIEKEKADIEEVNRKRLEAIQEGIDKTKELKRIQDDIDDTKRSIEQEKILADLEKQGATVKRLHEQRLKFLEEEHDKELSRLDNPNDEIAKARINAEFEKRKIHEVAEYNKAAQKDVEDTEELRRNKRNADEEKAMVDRKAKDKEIHDFRMRLIDEEEQRLIAKANTEAEKFKAQTDAERAREAEKKRHKEATKDEPKVPAKPLTRKEIAANLRKEKDKQRTEIAIRKGQEASKRRVANINRALKNQELAEERTRKDKVLKVRRSVRLAITKPAKPAEPPQEKLTPKLDRLIAAAEKTNTNEEILQRKLDVLGTLQ